MVTFSSPPLLLMLMLPFMRPNARYCPSLVQLQHVIRVLIWTRENDYWNWLRGPLTGVNRDSRGEKGHLLKLPLSARENHFKPMSRLTPVIGNPLSWTNKFYLMFGNGFLFGRPKAEVRNCARSEHLIHGIVGQALDSVIVRVFQNSFQLGSPNDHRFISRP